MHHSSRTRITLAIAFAVSLMGSTGTALARPDAGPALPSQASHGCTLQRVGTQFVACDNLTGNGVPAPSWIPQR